MAGINLSSIILDDRWPGAVNPNLGIPKGGFDNTTDNYTTTAASDTPKYPLGTKIMAYTDNSWAPGWYTMMYLMYHSYESGATYDISADISDGWIGCLHCDGSTAQHYNQQGDTSTIPYYVVGRCITAVATDLSSGGGATALPCCSIGTDGTDSYTQGYGDAFGWFWVGGVCPAKDLTFFDNIGAGKASVCAGIGACVTGDFATRAKGNLYFEITAALSTCLLTNDITTYIADATYAIPIVPIGYSCMTAI